MTDFSELRASISSPVLEPTDPGFVDALSGQVLGLVNTPEAVVVAADATAVAGAVRFGAAAGLPVRAFATGHGAHHAITDGLAITMGKLDALSVDAESRIATFGGGVRWGAVVAAAAPFGLAPITGSSPTVGATGYLLGGGVGPLARSHGVSSDWVRGFSVVTAAGEIVEASATENPDLFWALRGGKAGFGIVVETRLELAPIAELYAGNVIFDTDSIEPVLRAWIDFTAGDPGEATTSVSIVRMPPFEFIPQPIRGKTLIALRFARPGDAQTGAAIAEPLLAAGTPLMGGLGALPLAEVSTIHNDPTDPAPAQAGGGTLKPLDQDFASALLAVAGAGKQLAVVAIELRHIGAATKTDVASGSAVGGRENEYLFNLVGMTPSPEAAAAFGAGARAVRAAIGDWISERTTVNFNAPTNATEFASSWSPETFERLATVRATWDPDSVFPYGAAEAG